MNWRYLMETYRIPIDTFILKTFECKPAFAPF